jgi:hypothetical protein
MPIDLIFSPAQPNNPFEIARRKLLIELSKLPVPAIDVSPRRGQFADVNDHVRDFAGAFDRWFREVGEEVRCNAYTNIDARMFNSAFSGAIDGFATYEIDRAEAAVSGEFVS